MTFDCSAMAPGLARGSVVSLASKKRKANPRQSKGSADSSGTKKRRTPKSVNKASGCPECGNHESSVTDSRKGDGYGGEGVYRRRQCLSCGHKWSTTEIPSDRLRQFQAFEAALRALQGIKV